MCFICKSTFRTLSLLQHHVSKHDIIAYKQFTCYQNECIRVFDKLKYLYQHIRKFHSDLSNASKNSSQAVSIEHKANTTSNDDQACSFSHSESFPVSSCESALESKLYDPDDLSFVLSHYSSNNFNRSDIQSIIDRTSLWAVKKFCINPFEHLDSEFKIQKALTNESLWIEPVEFVLEFFEGIVKSGSSQRIVMKPLCCYIIPLRDTFLKVLGDETTLALARDHMSNRTFPLLSDAKDGSFCRNLSP